jgi:hypothetical protein
MSTPPLCGLIFFVANAFAQNATHAWGSITDAEGIGIVAAKVRLFVCGDRTPLATGITGPGGEFSFTCLMAWHRCWQMSVSEQGIHPLLRIPVEPGEHGKIAPIVVKHREPLPAQVRVVKGYEEQHIRSVLRFAIGSSQFMAATYQGEKFAGDAAIWRVEGNSWKMIDDFQQYERVQLLRYRGGHYVWIYNLDRHGNFDGGNLVRVDKDGKLTQIWTTERDAATVCCGKPDPDAENLRTIGQLLKPDDDIHCTQMLFRDDDLKFEFSVCNPKQRSDLPCIQANCGTEVIKGSYAILGDRLKIVQIHRMPSSVSQACPSFK